ncbi:MAG: YHS domain-containing (seleno)protein [Bacteroidota bacterium]
MKNLLFILMILSILFSCSQSKKGGEAEADTETEEVVESTPEESTEVTESEAELALDGYDVVTYFSEGPAKGNAEFSSVYDNKTYYFVSADNMAAFEAEPGKFAPQYGGWCAYGMSQGGKFPSDPETYKIVEDKLLVFYNDGEKNTKLNWEEGDEPELVVSANDNWVELSGE